MTMTLSVLAGCSSKEATKESSADTTETKNDKNDSGKDNETGASDELEGSLISEDPKTFTIFGNFNNMPFDSDWEVWQVMAEKTNIHFDGVISISNASEEEAYNLMLSSGELADVITYKSVGGDLEKLGRDGGLVALNDLIKEHAPNIQALLDSNSTFKQGATALDGNIYFIPKISELKSAEFYWIRQDWLNALNLDVPSTVDELYTVLTAFRNDDPNGNGEKDEIPLMDRAGWKMPDEYLYLFDSSTEFYPRDGQMTFEPLTDNFVYGVNNLAKWYAEGLIDPEIFTRGAKSRDILYSANQAGFTHDWPSTGNYNRSLAEDIPGFTNVAIPPMKNQNGEIIERTTRFPGVGWAISSHCEDPITLIKFFDYLFAKEGNDYINWGGIEGDTYLVNADGTKAYTDKVMNDPDNTPLSVLRSMGIQYRVGMYQDPAYEYAFMTPEAAAAAKLYNSNTEWYLEDMPPFADGKLNLKYTAEDETEYKKIMSQIRPYVDEMFQKWMLGASNIEDDYDAFVAELKSRNIDRAIEINQNAYETFLGK